jgi:tRNA(Ile)-lysidine synthase TilS/MesJ
VPGDHIAVALSGDAGSSALLYFLKKLTASRRDIRISAITVDEGIAGYRDMRIATESLDRWARIVLRCLSVNDLGYGGQDCQTRKGSTTHAHVCRVIRVSCRTRRL